jgi:hypothetical protein
MRTTSQHLGVWARLFVLPESGDTRATTATLPHPALIAAITICGVLGGISLLIPPFIDIDSGFGFLAWRSTMLGAVNSVITPNPANISQDTAEFLAAFSPGQYLIPGAISLVGVPLGIALTLTVVLSMLACLIGWIRVVQTFVARPSVALAATVLIGSFRYSTSAFSIYHGGEILLQAATPWLILTAYRVPQAKGVPAALLAAGAMFLAFLAKITGLIVFATAFIASSLVVLSFGRRITYGMIGGALGALGALAILYVTFLSRGWTAGSVTNWSLPSGSIAFASLAPWVAGTSWSDPFTSIVRFNLPGWASPNTVPGLPGYSMPVTYLLGVVVPPAVVVIVVILSWRPQGTNEQRLKVFSLWFYCLMAAIFILLYAHGAMILPDERHFRSAGTLLFVCALVSALTAGTPRWAKSFFLVLCAAMALYGLASFAHRAWITASGRSLDRTSWTNQRIFDAAAIDFARKAYSEEGRDALFVLPSFQLAVTLPTNARIFAIDLESIEIENVQYLGRVPGHIFVLLPNTVWDYLKNRFDTSKGPALLLAFRDYAPDAWKRKTFADMSVFFQ